MANDKIYVDKKGYQEYLKEISDLEAKVTDIRAKRLSTVHLMADDKDAAMMEIESSNLEEARVREEIDRKVAMLSRLEIIEKAADCETITINDYVVANLVFSKSESENYTFRLVSTGMARMDKDIRDVSVDSPLGKAVLGKVEGDSGEYYVNGMSIAYEIVAKAKTIEELKNVKLTLQKK